MMGRSRSPSRTGPPSFPRTSLGTGSVTSQPFPGSTVMGFESPPPADPASEAPSPAALTDICAPHRFVHRKYAIRWGAIASACGHQDYGFSRASGLNDLETPLYPAAQTIAAPGLVDTDTSRLAAPTLGLDTVVQAVPFQFREKVRG